ncbi:MAG: response regulator [Gemmatimonadetes bacterium]|nr:response regulator [Gemmatimonadota bacterium]
MRRTTASKGISGHTVRTTDSWSEPAGRRKPLTAPRSADDSYRSLIDGALHGIYRSSVTGKFLTVNPAMVRMLGYGSAQELLGVDMAHDVYADAGVRAQLIKQYCGAERFAGVEVQWKRKDGTPIAVHLSGRAVRNTLGEVECFEMVAEDVTARSRLEAQLRQAQKMEAVGQLTAGIAHDLNNILTVASVNTDFVLSLLPPELRQLRGDLEELQTAVRRGTAMIKKLLAFSRRDVLQLGALDLGQLISETTSMLRRIVPETVAVELASQESVVVQADPTAVEQILLNLATNARDAMPNGGVLRIAIQCTVLDEGYHGTHPWVLPGRYACMTVSDTGTGMDAATRERVFEPFFTTKPRGAGSGLGMAMIYGLVKQHGGLVHVYSEPGQGTTVKIYFPLATHSEAAGVHPEAARVLPRGTETILVAEDEASIRRATRRMLEQYGYTVLLAADGEEALELFRAHEGEIDLVITDLVMPKLGGRQVYDTLRREEKSVPVVFTSGYSERDVQGSVHVDPDVPFVHKPWTVAEFVVRIRQVLDGCRRPSPSPLGP